MMVSLGYPNDSIFLSIGYYILDMTVSNKKVDYNFLDAYSLAHFAFGVVAYYIGITFEQWFWMHIIFELVENSIITRTFANKFMYSFGFEMVNVDTLANSLGDQVSAMTGWLVTYFFDKVIFKREPTPIYRNVLTANNISQV